MELGLAWLQEVQALPTPAAVSRHSVSATLRLPCPCSAPAASASTGGVHVFLCWHLAAHHVVREGIERSARAFSAPCRVRVQLQRRPKLTPRSPLRRMLRNTMRELSWRATKDCLPCTPGCPDSDAHAAPARLGEQTKDTSSGQISPAESHRNPVATRDKDGSTGRAAAARLARPSGD
jgi:hypothetical protein